MERRDRLLSVSQPERAGQVIYMNADMHKDVRDCSEITKIDFKNIDTASVVDMGQMFYGMDSIKTLKARPFLIHPMLRI